MTFLGHHSGGTESLEQLARGVTSANLRAPSEARVSWLGTPSWFKIINR